jgi:hypothetical protein
MIFIKKDAVRYDIAQVFFLEIKRSKELHRKAVAFFLCHSIPKKDSSRFSSPSS